MGDNCSSCYFGDKCHCRGDCDDYVPIETVDDMDELIEHRRLEFIDEWYEYVREYSD